MGKRAAIRSLTVSISLISYHKILYEKGGKQEAKKHLQDEIRNYDAVGFDKAQKYSLNPDELKEIKEKSIKRTATIIKNKYPDIKYSNDEIEEKVIDTMQELLL